MLTRREILQYAGLGTLAAGSPSLAFARANTDSRFVLVILRGAVDGLALAPPCGDARYASLRGELAIGSPGTENGALKLDGLFGLHPALPNLHDLFNEEQALIVHATASPYRERSHFDGQDVLENGAKKVGLARDGWLNRAIGPLGGSTGHELAIALTQNTPLVLRGDNSVTSWAPSELPEADEDVLDRIADLYAEDAFFATRLARALDSQSIAGTIEERRQRRRGNEREQLKSMARAAARFLVAPDGPQIAVLEVGGWDTHANQGAASGALANRFAALDESVAELQRGLGGHWAKTVVAIVTEFGRTVRVNGTRGTDHGTATAALLIGGAVHGGRVIADWPGLGDRDLYEGRDLRATTDLRSVFKSVLLDHLGVDEAYADANVFPDSAAARPIPGLVRS